MSDTTTCGWCAESVDPKATRCPHCQGDIAGGRAYLASKVAERASATGAAPKAAAGWYPHPTMVDTRRYWDGVKWTNHIAPADPVTPPAPAAAVATAGAPKTEMAWVWLVALSPAIWIVLELALPRVANHPATLLIVTAVSIALLIVDERQLKARGIDVSAWWLLAWPLYLVRRTISAKSTPWVPITWFALFGLYLVVVFAWSSGPYDYTEADLDEYIASELSNQLGTDVSVDCPPALDVYGGDEIECAAVDSTGSGTVLVEFNDDGSYTFNLTKAGS